MIAFVASQLCGLFLAVAYPLLAAYKDVMQIDANGSLDTLKESWHRNNVLIRVVVFVPFAVAFVVENATLYGKPFESLVVGATYLLYASALFWLLFDYLLNSLRGLPAWYQGKNAKWDKLGTKNNKLLAVIITAIGYSAACYWFLGS